MITQLLIGIIGGRRGGSGSGGGGGSEETITGILPASWMDVSYNGDIVNHTTDDTRKMVDGSAASDWLPNLNTQWNKDDYAGQLTRFFHPHWNTKVNSVTIKVETNRTLTTPTQCYLRVRDTGDIVSLGNFEGEEVTFIPDDTSIIYDAFIMIGHDDLYSAGVEGWAYCWGSEVEINATYTNATLPASESRTYYPIGNFIGTNTNPWNMATIGDAITISEDKVAKYNRSGIKKFRCVRPHYSLEHSGKINYDAAYNSTTRLVSSNHTPLAFDPYLAGAITDAPELLNTYMIDPDYTGWYNEKWLDRYVEEGYEMMWQNQLNHPVLQETFAAHTGEYPIDIPDPTAFRGIVQQWTFFSYDDRNDRTNPFTYCIDSLWNRILASRWGAVDDIPDEMMGRWGIRQYHEAHPNTIRKGLNYPVILGTGNENDRTWGGAQQYMDPWKLAAMQSAIFDGHKGAIRAKAATDGNSFEFYTGAEGQDINDYRPLGVKNADPDLPVVTSGLAFGSFNTLKGMIEWSAKNRGYLTIEGKKVVDVPFDIFDYHKYNADSTNGQAGLSTTALPPEVDSPTVEGTSIINEVKQMIELIERYCPQVQLNVSEWGYDWHPYSRFGVPEIQKASGHYTRKEGVAMWAIRTMILFATTGLRSAHWFQTLRNAFTGYYPAPVIFETMELFIEAQDSADVFKYFPCLVADYMAQLKAYSDYTFDRFVSTDPYVTKFTKSGSPDVYFIWQVEEPYELNDISKYLVWSVETVDSIGFTEQTGTYNLSLANGTRCNVKEFRNGAEMPVSSQSVVSGGALPVNYGSNPVVIEVDVEEETFINHPVITFTKELNTTSTSEVLTATVSHPGGGTTVTVEWILLLKPYYDSDAGFTSTNTLSTTFQNMDSGANEYHVRIEVTDSLGNKASAECEIHKTA